MSLKLVWVNEILPPKQLQENLWPLTNSSLQVGSRKSFKSPYPTEKFWKGVWWVRLVPSVVEECLPLSVHPFLHGLKVTAVGKWRAASTRHPWPSRPLRVVVSLTRAGHVTLVSLLCHQRKRHFLQESTLVFNTSVDHFSSSQSVWTKFSFLWYLNRL